MHQHQQQLHQQQQLDHKFHYQSLAQQQRDGEAAASAPTTTTISGSNGHDLVLRQAPSGPAQDAGQLQARDRSPLVKRRARSESPRPKLEPSSAASPPAARPQHRHGTPTCSRPDSSSGSPAGLVGAERAAVQEGLAFGGAHQRQELAEGSASPASSAGCAESGPSYTRAGGAHHMPQARERSPAPADELGPGGPSHAGGAAGAPADSLHERGQAEPAHSLSGPLLHPGNNHHQGPHSNGARPQPFSDQMQVQLALLSLMGLTNPMQWPPLTH